MLNSLDKYWSLRDFLQIKMPLLNVNVKTSGESLALMLDRAFWSPENNDITILKPHTEILNN